MNAWRVNKWIFTSVVQRVFILLRPCYFLWSERTRESCGLDDINDG